MSGGDSLAVPEEYSYARYLAAKKSIDGRAINGRIWRELARMLDRREKPLRVLEAGAGIGTMIERMADDGLLCDAHYIAVDSLEENRAFTRLRLRKWTAGHGMRFKCHAPDRWVISGKGKQIEVCFRCEDILDYISTGNGGYDLLIASAFLDLVDLRTALPLLLGQLKDGGIFYFTVNFDGLTVLEPEVDSGLDKMVQELYHRRMDERVPGASRAGRHIFPCLKDYGARIIEAGPSDWVIFARPGGYTPDEEYFLYFILYGIYETVRKYPDVDRDRLDAWISLRHGQVEQGELVYIAHQLDFLGTV